MAQSGDKYVLREFTLNDYDEYASWWDDPPPVSSIPNIGYVSGDMKAVGFLALTDCDFCILTWWCANPQNKGKESYMALDRIVKGCVDTARLIGKNYVFCYTNERGMIRLLESAGFKNNDGHLVAEAF